MGRHAQRQRMYVSTDHLDRVWSRWTRIQVQDVRGCYITAVIWRRICECQDPDWAVSTSQLWTAVVLHHSLDRDAAERLNGIRPVHEPPCCENPRSHSLTTSFLSDDWLVTFSCLPSVKVRRKNKNASSHFRWSTTTTVSNVSRRNSRLAS